MSKRTVRTCLDRLEAASIISPCDPHIAAARIKRADRRPQGWDLNLGLVRDDLDDADVAVLERRFPGIATRLAAARLAGDGQPDGVQSPHPEPGRSEVVDNSADGVQQLRPAQASGCNQRSYEVQLEQPRGAMVAPEPYTEPPREPSAAPKAPPATIAKGGCEPVGEYFAALGLDWRLTDAQQARLTPAVVAALAPGWTPSELARRTGCGR